MRESYFKIHISDAIDNSPGSKDGVALQLDIVFHVIVNLKLRTVSNARHETVYFDIEFDFVGFLSPSSAGHPKDFTRSKFDHCLAHELAICE